MRLIVLALSSTALAACGPSTSSPPDAAAVARAAIAAPSDERLATLYRQSCRTCHSLANTGAPLAQDRSQWDERWQKGLPALVHSTVSGLNGMPPGGQCFACTAQDYEALIKFLADRP